METVWTIREGVLLAKGNRQVEYGFKPEDATEKGTLIVLDSFDGFTADRLAKIAETAEAKQFARLVLFPHNEKTLKTMTSLAVQPFHKRAALLEDLVDDLRTGVRVSIDKWEEKRKKYTPVELLLRYFEETYPAPFFFYVTDGYANMFAAFASFDEMIRKVRLLVERRDGVPPSAKLAEVRKRWEYA